MLEYLDCGDFSESHDVVFQSVDVLVLDCLNDLLFQKEVHTMVSGVLFEINLVLAIFFSDL